MLCGSDERVEREAPAAFHDLGHAVDRDHVLDLIARMLPVAVAPLTPAAPLAAPGSPSAATTTTSTTTGTLSGRALGRRRRLFLGYGRLFRHLELQSAF